MGVNHQPTQQIQDYTTLGLSYLESSYLSLKNELYEPALFNAIHALELILKAALLTKTNSTWRTHNIGGMFGNHFKHVIGPTTCKQINIILTKYPIARYPGEPMIPHDEVENVIDTITISSIRLSFL
jgi:HEPN domain-containing protein